MPNTHDVLNQPPPLEDYNLYLTDPVLDRAIAAEGGKESREVLVGFGERVGSAEAFEWGFLANTNDPVLHTHDRYGHRIDEVEFHPSWHSLMDLAISNGLHSLPWEDRHNNGQVTRTALLYMSSQVEAGHFCPISMTTSVVPALKATEAVAAKWVPRIIRRSYDPSFQPVSAKSGALMGMGMTEKQGGSDVRSNTTTARPRNGGGPGAEYSVTGHKWFTSAPMCDAFLVLAQAPGGLSCFLLPRWTPDGVLNGFQIQRLKDKLGNRSNASSEVEFNDAHAVLVGEEGRGISTILEMVNGTRLDCVMGSTALMRQAVAQAGWHTAHREAFGSKLIDKPLMQNVLADLEIETETATLMMVRLAGAFDRAEFDQDEAAFRRIALPVAKYWVTKQTTAVVREAMECLGGNGYVEESILPRLFRESPLNAIWEGSGNVIALDFIRAANREPAALEVFFTELESSVTPGPLRQAVESARGALVDVTNPEAEARRIVESVALAWAGTLCARHEDEELLGAFAASRLDESHGAQFGALATGLPLENLARRTVPQF
ncbi:MAG: acyl-CoA dehydrogenase family protein [Acidimicrobiia bacterium]